jgi:CHAD domain-containing protein
MREEERELKLSAPGELDDARLLAAVRAAGFEPGEAAKRRQRDRYLDTAELDLARHGLALRRRDADGAAWLCLKAEGQAAPGGVWSRLEHEVEAVPTAPLPAAAAELPEALRHRVEPVAWGRALAEVARLETERTVHTVRAPLVGVKAELALDRVELEGAGGFTEVEIELGASPSAPFETLAVELRERLGLLPSPADKLARALTLAGGARPSPPRSTPLEPALPFALAAGRIFRRHLEALRLAEPVARMGEDPEGVHDVRVAARRLRAAFRTFRGAFPAPRLAGPLRCVRATGRALGAVRDLDVLLAGFRELAPELPEPLADDLAPLAGLVHELRERERARMLRFLGSPGRLRAMERFERFVSGLEAREARPGRALRGAGGRPVGEVAPELLRAAAARVWKRGERIDKDSPREDLHALRIAVKRLRYTAESFVDLYGKPLRGLVRRAAVLQDLLGAYNDAGVAAVRLTGWLETPKGRRLPRATWTVAGALLALYDARGRAARAGFKAAWRELSRGKARRELEAMLGGA